MFNTWLSFLLYKRHCHPHDICKHEVKERVHRMYIIYDQKRTVLSIADDSVLYVKVDLRTGARMSITTCCSSEEAREPSTATNRPKNVHLRIYIAFVIRLKWPLLALGKSVACSCTNTNNLRLILFLCIPYCIWNKGLCSLWNLKLIFLLKTWYQTKNNSEQIYMQPR